MYASIEIIKIKGISGCSSSITDNHLRSNLEREGVRENRWRGLLWFLVFSETSSVIYCSAFRMRQPIILMSTRFFFPRCMISFLVSIVATLRATDRKTTDRRTAMKPRKIDKRDDAPWLNIMLHIDCDHVSCAYTSNHTNRSPTRTGPRSFPGPGLIVLLADFQLPDSNFPLHILLELRVMNDFF